MPITMKLYKAPVAKIIYVADSVVGRIGVAGVHDMFVEQIIFTFKLHQLS